MSATTARLLAVPFLTAAAAAAAASPAQDAEAPPTLEPGVPIEALFDLSALDESVAVYRFNVPVGAAALRVELVSGQADLDLLVGLEQDGEVGDPFVYGGSDLGREEVLLDRFGEPVLVSGVFRVEVRYGWPELPVWDGERVSRVPYTLRADVVETREDGALLAGARLFGTLDDESGRFRTYRVEVPEDAPALRVDVVEADGDVDLFLRRARPGSSFGRFVQTAENVYGCETLLLERGVARGLRAGTWFVDVVERFSLGTGPTRFALQLGFAAEPAAELLEVAPYPAAGGAGELARAVPSVVELFTSDSSGSGTIVDARGLVLTNAHLVADLGGAPLEEVVVAVTADPRVPSVERFRGRVVRFDVDRDLALVRVDRGLFGQPLPADYRFPALERGDAATLGLGDALWLVGYPGTGGTRTRVSITATRGIAAGFEQSAFGTLIKTDAALHGGHSGGAVLDAEGRFLAVPSFVIQDDTFAGLGYLIPLAAVPDEWWSAADAPAPR